MDNNSMEQETKDKKPKKNVDKFASICLSVAGVLNAINSVFCIVNDNETGWVTYMCLTALFIALANLYDEKSKKKDESIE